MTRILPAAAILLLALPTVAFAQNPRGAVNAEIGGVSVTIDHGRPALGDRSLGDLLGMLPPERVWRAGENQVTTLETSGDLMVGGHHLPAGRYSLYLHIPESGDWSLLVNRHLGIALGELWAEAPEAMRGEPWPMLSGYAAIESEEQVRIPLEEADAAGDGDVFEIAVAGDELRFAWGGMAYRTTLRAHQAPGG